MPVFVFQARALGGKVVKGEITASTDIEARVKLRAQQLIPVKVLMKGESKLSLKPAGGNWGKSVKAKDLQVFTRQFATLINSGIPVVQSLEILGNATQSEGIKEAAKKVKADVEGGKPLAEAIMNHPKVFDRLYVNLVKAGEQGGVLDTILNRLAAYIEKSVKIKNKVQGAMYYPGAIIGVAIIVIVAILVFVIPKFEELFKSSGQELPWLTKMVVAMSHWMFDYWYIPLFALVGGYYGFRNWINSVEGRKTFDTFILKVPVMGSLALKSAIARFSRTLSTMLSCGVSIIEALDIAAKVSGNYVIEQTILSAKQAISEGKSVTTPLLNHKYIPDMVVQMIGVGEQTGAMDVMLGKVADFYEEEVDYAVTALTSIMEPLMMVFLGGIIAVLVIAMYLPIFNMASTMGV